MTRAMSSRSAVLAALSLLVAVPAAAEDERPVWMPYIEFAVDLHQDKVFSSIQSSVPFFQVFTGAFNYSNTPVGFSGRLGVLGPQIGWSPGAPRVFVDAGVYATPETNEIILDFGDLDSSLGIQEGSRLRRRFRNPAAAAGLGLEFTLPWVQERFRIKPSLEYEWEKVRLDGRFTIDLGAFGMPDFRQSVEEDYHSLGAGLEGEMRVYGGFSLYVDLRLLWIVSGAKAIYFDNEPGNVTWTYIRKDDPTIHGAFGFRYAYQGF